jgi:hypothetical protein
MMHLSRAYSLPFVHLNMNRRLLRGWDPREEGRTRGGPGRPKGRCGMPEEDKRHDAPAFSSCWSQTGFTNSSWLYFGTDGVHPNANGHYLVACLVGRLLDLAMSEDKPALRAGGLGLLRPPAHLLEYVEPVCFRMTHSANEGPPVLQNRGFFVAERALPGQTNSTSDKKKRSWEATTPGNLICMACASV